MEILIFETPNDTNSVLEGIIRRDALLCLSLYRSGGSKKERMFSFSTLFVNTIIIIDDNYYHMYMILFET